jgi:hypothetical protein
LKPGRAAHVPKCLNAADSRHRERSEAIQNDG